MASSYVLDNLTEDGRLLTALSKSLGRAFRADVCVGYFHLRGWSSLTGSLTHFEGGDAGACRVIVGMNRPPQDEMRRLQRARLEDDEADGPELARRRTRAIEDFREQLSAGVPSKQAESALRALAHDLRAGRVRVALFLRHQLHAKLYLTYRNDDEDTPRIAYVGSSNFTYSGLRGNGELNVRVGEPLMTEHLARWFEDRWAQADDISDELATLIETSWARETLTLPYHVYLRIAYHLSEDARAGTRDLRIPPHLDSVLLQYQKPAVLHAAQHLLRRGGALLGDVVGLGKTITAIATAAVLQEDGGRTLVVCPPKLVSMWRAETERFNLHARVVSHGQLERVLPTLGTWQTLIVDESHNFRNDESERYRHLKAYIDDHGPRVLLLSATPYNKQYADLGAQLRLFLGDIQDLRIRPEALLKEWRDRGKDERHFEFSTQAPVRSLRAFEQSPHPDDWRDLLRLFLVRRTRSFILHNFATYDSERDRSFVEVQGTRHYFPVRTPHTVGFDLDPATDPYARLLRAEVVDTIGTLSLPRYGLTLFLRPTYNPDAWAKKGTPPDLTERQVTLLRRLTRSGKRLIGVTRTGLFKRLESSGLSFLISLERHVLRNLVYVHALDHGLDLPLGGIDVADLDAAIQDEDDPLFEGADLSTDLSDGAEENAPDLLARLQARARDAYASAKASGRVDNWLPARFFTPAFRLRLLDDAEALARVLREAGTWEAAHDAKFIRLLDLVETAHGSDKVLVFTQFADTARFLARELTAHGVDGVGLAVSGDATDPTDLARRFSPRSNARPPATTALHPGETEIRVLVATDVLSEGQNLQDAHIVVNYDLPWAIIRLIQRAGRVDRIGQRHPSIEVYSFLPTGDVEQIIGLRRRLSERLKANQEVIGTDEAFFGDEDASALRDLYAERDGSLDDPEGVDDVDLASSALQIWNSASDRDRRAALDLPAIVSAARTADLPDRAAQAQSVVTYLLYPDGSDALMRVDPDGRVLSASLSATFRAIACPPDTPALPLAPYHYDRVAHAVAVATAEQATAGALGNVRETRRRVYDRLERQRHHLAGQASLFDPGELDRLDRARDALYLGPLKTSARERLGRALRNGLPTEALARVVLELLAEGALTTADAPAEAPEPRVVCSLGLV